MLKGSITLSLSSDSFAIRFFVTADSWQEREEYGRPRQPTRWFVNFTTQFTVRSVVSEARYALLSSDEDPSIQYYVLHW